jgi:hypothetical protein
MDSSKPAALATPPNVREQHDATPPNVLAAATLACTELSPNPDHQVRCACGKLRDYRSPHGAL